ncbi:MAG: MarR family transcriptional regulator [Verrucomicrobiota bacterium]|jgi:MarR family 2-MHQ and catechol resistance regulon transcriptional repressor
MKAAPPSANQACQALVQLLRAADTVWNASRAFFARWGLSPSQFNVLNLLEGNPSGLSQTELSRQLIMHRSNVTGLVDRLERRRLVRREDAVGDRRAYRVVLTPDGARLLGDVLPRYYEEARRVCEHLSERRAAELVADFGQIAQNAEQIAAGLAQPERRRKH